MLFCSAVSVAGAQTGIQRRCGDRSNLTVDPVDDCTFWYTNQYLRAVSTSNWATRIGSFKFPNCSITDLIFRNGFDCVP